MLKLTQVLLLGSLLGLLWDVRGQGVPAACSTSMKFCSSTGTFYPRNSFLYFEGSIGLFESGFFTFYDETRAAF